VKVEQLRVGSWYLLTDWAGTTYCKYVRINQKYVSWYIFQFLDGGTFQYSAPSVGDFVSPCSASFSKYLDLFASNSPERDIW